MPPRVPHSFPDVSNQAVVHIDVSSGTIERFPKREGETVVFNCHDPSVPPGFHPCEVRWVVTGLGPKQCVRIAPKDDESAGMFAGPAALEIRGVNNSVTSGRPGATARAGPGRSLAYAYEIVLVEETKNGEVVKDRVDPIVIIKDYP